MTTQEGNDAIVARHLEALANAAKDYTLAELANITVGGASYALATTVSSGLMSASDKAKLDTLKNYTLPTASTTQKGGVIIGDGLQMDGDTLSVTLQGGSAGSGIDYVIGSNVSTVEGGFWQDIYNDVPILKLRHGDYEYNFQYDGLTFIGGASSALVNTTPNTYVLGTASSTVEGGVWYEVNNDVPTLNLHNGSFNYSFNYDSVTYKGGNSHLVAYLPFDASTTADACGNTWATQGEATLDTEIKKFGAASLHLPAGAYIQAENIIDLEAEQWTFDTWVLRKSDGAILSFGTAAQRYWGINIDNEEIMFGNTTHGNWECKFGYGSTFPSNAWFHFAIVKDGLTFYFFCNGSLFWNPTVSSLEANNNVFRLGGNEVYGDAGDMYFDNVRFSEGVALWTSDFTPPTAADYT